MNKLIALSSVIFLITACTALPGPQAPASVYDFGIPPVSSTTHPPETPQRIGYSILVADAAAPSWLDSTAMHYRLLYQNPAQTYTYANSRWIATPAALLTQQIRNRIATGTPEQVTKDFGMAKTDYVLHLELEEVVQLFDTTTDSRVALGFRASLVERNRRKLIVQKDFYRIENAPTADAAGAVSALSTASAQSIDALIEWLIAELPVR